MINSLFKDSHITRVCRSSKLNQTRRNKEQNRRSSVTVNNSIGISVSKPAGINFRGLVSAKLAHNEFFQKFFNNVKTFLGDKVKLKDIRKLLDDTFDLLSGSKKDTNTKIESFLKLHKKDMESIVQKTKLLIEEENKISLSPEDLQKEIKSTINAAVDGIVALENNDKSKIFTNKYIKKFLNMATDNPAVFDALFALGLTCILRPVSIMTLPGSKNNKEDKKYAAAHSIASGVIAYLMSLVLFYPIAEAMKKIMAKPEHFNLKYLLKDKKALDAAGSYMKKLPEAALAPFRAIVTIALIPVILENVFGWKKKNVKNKNIKPDNQNQPLTMSNMQIKGGVK